MYPVHASPALSSLDVYIKDYNLSLRPRLRVPVSPSCVHRDTIIIANDFFDFIIARFYIMNIYYETKTEKTKKNNNVPLMGLMYLPVIMSLSFPIFTWISASFRGFGPLIRRLRLTTKYHVKSNFTDKQCNIN